jgi:hypothetical protein
MVDPVATEVSNILRNQRAFVLAQAATFFGGTLKDF